MADEIARVGDVGVALRATVKTRDESGVLAAMDVAAMTGLSIVFMKPDETTITRTASFYTDGTDGVVQYVTQSGDLDQSGTWKLDAVLTAAGVHLTSTVFKFKVGVVLDADV